MNRPRRRPPAHRDGRLHFRAVTHYRSRLRFLAAALIPLARAAHTQSPRIVRSETNAWLNVGADVWLAPRFGLQGEMLYERSDFAEDPMQVEARLGVQRLLRSGARIAAGGTLIHNSPYGPFPARGPFREYRAWEQFTIDHRAGAASLTHRYRLEQRWVERPGSATTAGGHVDVAYGMRFRYQLRGTVPLSPATARHPAYAAAADELFLSIGPHTPLNLLDQNRAYLGAGLRWSPSVRAELGYLSQVILRADGRQVEHNHTLQATLGLTRAAPRRR